jgi:hypothetical protein
MPLLGPPPLLASLLLLAHRPICILVQSWLAVVDHWTTRVVIISVSHDVILGQVDVIVINCHRSHRTVHTCRCIAAIHVSLTCCCRSSRSSSRPAPCSPALAWPHALLLLFTLKRRQPQVAAT